MSIDYEEYRTPQPEKWLIEHEPFVTLAVLTIGATAAILLAIFA